MTHFKSKLEATFHSTYKLDYEVTVLPYTIPESSHRYTPDFKVSDTCYIETKGKLDLADRSKMLLVKEQHPGIIFCMVFQRNYSLGKRLGTCVQWAHKNGFPAFVVTDTVGIAEFIKDHEND